MDGFNITSNKTVLLIFLIIGLIFSLIPWLDINMTPYIDIAKISLTLKLIITMIGLIFEIIGFIYLKKDLLEEQVNREINQIDKSNNITPEIQNNLDKALDNAFFEKVKLFGISEIATDIGKLFKKNDSWIISLFGEGGIGKTALANEILLRYGIEAGFTRFAWVSAKQQCYTDSLEVTTNNQNIKLHWSDFAKQIAEQLSIPIGYSSSEWFDDLKVGIHELSKDEKCLIIIDNLETIADIKVIELIDSTIHNKGLIKPHKVLITTRKSIQNKSTNIIEKNIKGLKSENAYELIEYLAKGNDEILKATHTELEPILKLTEGNPLLIKLAVNRFLVSKRPLNDVLNELKNTQLKDFLYMRSLEELQNLCGTENTNKFINAFCPTPSGESLSIQNLKEYSGISNKTDFYKIIEVASQLAIIRVSGGLQNRKYSIHSLLWNFICNENS
jgi:hypothetical protein